MPRNGSHRKCPAQSFRRAGFIAFSNKIILSQTLYATDKRLLFAMLCACGGGRCRKTYDELAALSGLSRRTVAASLVRLEEAGLLRREHTYHWSARLGRLVRGANIYRLAEQDMRSGYTLLPRSLAGSALTPAAFVAALEVYREAGRKGRSYSSVRRMAKLLDMAKATICRALHQFRSSQIISFLRCRFRGKKSHACNSYYPIDFVRAGQYPHKGGLKFALPIGINKITGACIGKENTYGVAQFGNIAKNEGIRGIEVSAWDAPDDICA